MAVTTGKAVGLIEALAKRNIDIDPEVAASVIADWLADHPEATTTVQDGSITQAKLHSDLAGIVENAGHLGLSVVNGAINITYEEVTA